MSESVHILRSVDVWVRKSVKSRAFCSAAARVSPRRLRALLALPYPHIPPLHLSTRLTKIKGTKLSELSLNFPRSTDWLCIGRPSCLAALGRDFFLNRGHFFYTNHPVVLGEEVPWDWKGAAR